MSVVRGVGLMQVPQRGRPRWGRVVDGTSVSMWRADGPGLRAADGWSFSFLDVEGVL
jgi:hypothetical protein